MISIRMSGETKEDFSNFLKSSLYAKYVAIVNNRETNFCGFVIDEVVVTASSLFKCSGYVTSDGDTYDDEVVYIPRRILVDVTKSALSSIIVEAEGNKIHITVDGVKLNFQSVEVSSDDEADYKYLIGVYNNLSDGYVINDDLLSLKKNFANFSYFTNSDFGSTYPIIEVEDGTMYGGKNSAYSVIKDMYPKSVSFILPYVMFKRLQLSTSLSGVVSAGMDDTMVFIRNERVVFIGDTYDYPQSNPNVEEVINGQETKATIVLSNVDVEKVVNVLKKLSIVLLTKKDKEVEMSVRENSINLTVTDISNMMSNESVDVKVSHNDTDGAVSFEIKPFISALLNYEDTKDSNLIINVKESVLEINFNNVIYYISIFV